MSKIFGENEVISEVDMYDEFSRNFIDYAATVNLQRAFPHVADGLKPSQRIWVEARKHVKVCQGCISHNG